MIVRSEPCPRCGSTALLDLDDEGLAKYRAGAHVQNAFPRLSADDRERMITGICPPCWDAMFKGDEDE